MTFLDDYVDVAERIRTFYDKYPEGSLQSLVNPEVVQAGDKWFVVYGAAAYRHPADTLPGIGWAWEPVPGPTPYTKDSELQNAETSAWGRAIVALGFETKKIASADEVRNRQVESPSPSLSSPPDPFPSSVPEKPTGPPTTEAKTRVNEVLAMLNEMRPDIDWVDVARTVAQTKFNKQDGAQLTNAEMWELATHMERKLEQKDPGTPVG